MRNITYKITFFSDWHVGSGLTSGSDIDALVIKDKDKLPFIPGKTLKGLLKDAVFQLLELQNKVPENEEIIQEMFGYFDGDNKKKSGIHTKGKAYFTNAVINENLRKTIMDEGLNKYLYRDISSTAIQENGLAKEHSLRRLETIIPCTLDAEIQNVNEVFSDTVIMAMSLIKRMGQNRHRGLGRCKFEIVETKEAES